MSNKATAAEVNAKGNTVRAKAAVNLEVLTSNQVNTSCNNNPDDSQNDNPGYQSNFSICSIM